MGRDEFLKKIRLLAQPMYLWSMVLNSQSKS